MKENNEKKIKNEDEISKLIKAFPKDEERRKLFHVFGQDSSLKNPF